MGFLHSVAQHARVLHPSCQSRQGLDGQRLTGEDSLKRPAGIPGSGWLPSYWLLAACRLLLLTALHARRKLMHSLQLPHQSNSCWLAAAQACILLIARLSLMQACCQASCCLPAASVRACIQCGCRVVRQPFSL